MLSKLTFNGIWWSYLFLDKKKKIMECLPANMRNHQKGVVVLYGANIYIVSNIINI